MTGAAISNDKNFSLANARSYLRNRLKNQVQFAKSIPNNLNQLVQGLVDQRVGSPIPNLIDQIKQVKPRSGWPLYLVEPAGMDLT